MGSLTEDRTKMKTFLASLLLSVASAAPSPAVSSHVVSHGHGAVVSHGSHVGHGLVAAHPVAHAVHAAPLVHAAPVHAVHAVHAPVHAVHAIHAPVVAHAAPVIAHAAPAYHAPAPVVVKEVPEPYTYSYGVADDYSKSNFQASESGDATGVVGGSYSVNLPDGRIQTVTYNADHANGYVAEVAYSGEAVYPPAPAGGYPGEGHAVVAAAPAYHA